MVVGDRTEYVARELECTDDGTDGARHVDPGHRGHALVGEDLAQAVLDVLVAGVVHAPVELLDRGAVPLVEDEQGPLLQHLVDQPVEEPCPRRRRRVVPHGVQRLATELVQTQVQRHQDVGLAGEVVVDRRFGEAEPVGDLPERRLVVALGAEQLEGDVEDALPGRCPSVPAVTESSIGPDGDVLGHWHARILLDDR